jgi:hypothetical protein
MVRVGTHTVDGLPVGILNVVCNLSFQSRAFEVHLSIGLMPSPKDGCIA